MIEAADCKSAALLLIIIGTIYEQLDLISDIHKKDMLK